MSNSQCTCTGLAMPTFYYIQIQGSGISLCCNLMITRPHNYVKENVQNLGIKNVRDQVERDLQIFFLWTMQKWQLLEVGFELFSWSWIPCRKKKMHFCVKLKRKGNSSNGWVCILQKKGNKTNARWGEFALFAKRLKWNHKCKNRDSKGKKVMKHTMVPKWDFNKKKMVYTCRDHIQITKHKMDCPFLVFSQELHTQVNSTLCGYCEAMGRFF
jgi:hypothetical protein